MHENNNNCTGFQMLASGGFYAIFDAEPSTSVSLLMGLLYLTLDFRW